MSSFSKVRTLTFDYQTNERKTASFHINTKVKTILQYVAETFHITKFQLIYNKNLIKNTENALHQIIKETKALIYIITDEDNIRYQKALSQSSNRKINFSPEPNSSQNDQIYSLMETNKALQKKNEELMIALQQCSNKDDPKLSQYMKEVNGKDNEIKKMKQTIATLSFERDEINKQLKVVKERLQKHMNEIKKKEDRKIVLKSVNHTFYELTPKKCIITAKESIESGQGNYYSKVKNSIWTSCLSYLDIKSILDLLLVNRSIALDTCNYLIHSLSFDQMSSSNRMTLLNNNYNNYLHNNVFALSQEVKYDMNQFFKLNHDDDDDLNIIANINQFDGVLSAICLMIYRLFFQFTNRIESSLLINTDEYINEVKKVFHSKITSLSTFEQYLTNSMELFDFSTNNISKIQAILLENNSISIDTKAIAFVCRGTGIIAHIVKEALFYSGLIIPNKLINLFNTCLLQKERDDLLKQAINRIRRERSLLLNR